MKEIILIIALIVSSDEAIIKVSDYSVSSDEEILTTNILISEV